MEGEDDQDRMMGSPSSEGKIVIKLKIPKLAPAAMEGEKPPEEVIGILPPSLKPVKEDKRICLECGKEFSSGKALGGHMRVHVNQSVNRNPNFLKHSKTRKMKKIDHHLNDIKKPYYMNSVNDEGKPTCSLCGKTFPSMKSLFGHMRCHPERVWRGILPPPNTSTTVERSFTLNGDKTQKQKFSSSVSGSSCSSGNDQLVVSEEGGDQVVDLTKFLSGWTVTERRGRRALKAVDDDEGLLEAVEDLMSLANYGVSMEESGVTRPLLKVEVTEGSNGSSLSNKDRKTDPNSHSIHLRVTGKGKAVMEEEIETKQLPKSEVEDDHNTNEQPLIHYKYKNDHNKIKKRKKMKLMMELDPNDDVPATEPPEPDQHQLMVTEGKYKCTTCNKCFTSHQALGGHRSSHNKPKFTSTDPHPVEEKNLSSENSDKEVSFGVVLENGCTTHSINNSISTSSSNVNLHQCKICDKIFATGQALGGHQRCHWTGPAGTQAPSSQITSTGEAASHTGDRKVLDFDLNEAPPAMMEEDEGGNNNGYASSSYNSNMC
ncbi:hypothetical protein R6Q59_015715 [Mikania micrantha]|uniref:C2H2-type domain-containing protein n=1 Tax=Mikania micrantha TaxID=192012 RepID=A0A5N6PJ50_9ASTR|nr:hypothetical protein E3N88_08659 [Mikania micrantha]